MPSTARPPPRGLPPPPRHWGPYDDVDGGFAGRCVGRVRHGCLRSAVPLRGNATVGRVSNPAGTVRHSRGGRPRDDRGPCGGLHGCDLRSWWSSQGGHGAAVPHREGKHHGLPSSLKRNGDRRVRRHRRGGGKRPLPAFGAEDAVLRGKPDHQHLPVGGPARNLIVVVAGQRNLDAAWTYPKPSRAAESIRAASRSGGVSRALRPTSSLAR